MDLHFEDVTLLFSDIVGFTTISSGHTAKEIVHTLNQMFTLFDERAKRMGVEKIKTIGDAYMAACGVPEKNKNHASIMVNFASRMESAANPGAIRITENLKEKLEGKGFEFTEPIECKIKGKGLMKTFEVIQ